AWQRPPFRVGEVASRTNRPPGAATLFNTGEGCLFRQVERTGKARLLLSQSKHSFGLPDAGAVFGLSAVTTLPLRTGASGQILANSATAFDVAASIIHKSCRGCPERPMSASRQALPWIILAVSLGVCVLALLVLAVLPLFGLPAVLPWPR